jgi:hypothetical protein
MKKTFLLAFVLMSFSVFAQEQDTLFMSKLMDKEWAQDFGNQTQFKFIKFEDGSVLGIGDKMKFGNPSGTNQSNTTQAGLFSSSTTRTNNYTYIMLGRMGAAMMGGVTYLPETFKGREAEIENIKLYKSKKEGKPHGASIIFNNPGMDISVLDLAFALQYGEVINPKAAMTSEQALAELKKAKDKLDLGLITQQQFDSLKVVLSKIIK